MDRRRDRPADRPDFPAAVPDTEPGPFSDGFSVRSREIYVGNRGRLISYRHNEWGLGKPFQRKRTCTAILNIDSILARHAITSITTHLGERSHSESSLSLSICHLQSIPLFFLARISQASQFVNSFLFPPIYRRLQKTTVAPKR